MNSLLYWCHGVFIKPDYRCLHLVKTLISTVHCYFPGWCSGSRPFSLLIEWWLGQSHSHIIKSWLAAWWPATWPLSLHDDRLLTDIYPPPGAQNTFKSMPGVLGWDTRARHILILLRSISTWMFSILGGTYLILFYTSEHRTGRNKQRRRSECSPNSVGRQRLHVDSQSGMMGNWKGTNVLKEVIGKHHMMNQAAHYVIFMSSTA